MFIEIEVAERRLPVNAGDERYQILHQKEIQSKKMKVIKKENVGHMALVLDLFEGPNSRAGAH